MSNLFPPPSIEPLQRLSVQDGLLLNAERWQCAHEYHRHRQNVHYQSLNQPGIVCGLGVAIIPAPADIAAHYRDDRWIGIQSGIAIDLLGNPIIVPQPIDFHIASEAQEPLTVYIVVSYVDPDKLQRQEWQTTVQETFRLDEKTSPPNELEVELCRILLKPGSVQLEKTVNVFFPGGNHLDLRYRQQARARSPISVRVAQVTNQLPKDSKTLSNLSYLLQAMSALYPTMSGAQEVGEVTLLPEPEGQKVFEYELLYLMPQQLTSLSNAEMETLKQYWESGGCLFVEIPARETNICELANIQQQLQEAIAQSEQETDLAKLRPQLEAELNATRTALAQQLSEVCSGYKKLLQQMGDFSEDSGEISRHHPLRTQPFLFGQLPTIDKHPIQLFNWGGLVLVIGELSSAWGLNEKILPRETIRTAQELGINILHFAWRRKQLIQLQQLEEGK